MGIRDVLVFLDETASAELRLKLATSIALEHGASVSGVFFSNGHSAAHEPAAPWLGILAAGSLGGTTAASPETMMEERFREQTNICSRGGIWLTFDASETDEAVNVTRSADLIVMGQIQPGRRGSPKWRPEDVIARCGRPVLMVPYIGNYVQIGRRVIVAWDGSREATRALNDALPLIHTADTVTLLSVHANPRERDQAHSATDRMVRHLGRHGIAAYVDEMSQLGSSTADLLLSRSMDLSADLMIAGVSHHSHWHEALFGGVSYALFRHMTLPILMSH